MKVKQSKKTMPATRRTRAQTAIAAKLPPTLGPFRTRSNPTLDRKKDIVKKYGEISNWDVSKVTDMFHMFDGAESFNQPLNKWDVSSVTNMSGMFSHATSFNQPLNN